MLGGRYYSYVRLTEEEADAKGDEESRLSPGVPHGAAGNETATLALSTARPFYLIFYICLCQI